jgi:hypothetical protein
VFSTGDPAVAGGTVQIRRSSNLRDWSYAGNVFDSIPYSARKRVHRTRAELSLNGKRARDFSGRERETVEASARRQRHIQSAE